MKFKRLLGIALALLMVLAVIPTASLAKSYIESQQESAKLALLDSVWDFLEEVENEAIEAGAESAELVYAVYNAAINDPRVDAGSMRDVSNRGFCFNVDGMCCIYNYVSRHVKHVSAINEEVIASASEAAAKTLNTKNGPVSANVLLIGPYYGHDGSFTNQYRNEAQSIANATGGTYTLIQSTSATGPAIAAAMPGAGVVIYDSHGTAMNGTSYLCLTTNSGLTSTDFSNGWAYNGGSSDAGIDGRYIQNHISAPLSHCLIWMAICEGMKLSGHGVTGYALLDAGAGCVYGYSQSVTFAGDYVIEALFWNKMKNEDYTVAEAFAYMVSNGCSSDGSEPHGNAFPIVMSADDPFPANPDSAQTVYCDWTLFGGTPIDPEGVTFAQESYNLAPTFQLRLQPIVNPDGANNFSKEWTSSDPSVATVDNKGLVTGVRAGTTTITYTIASTVYSEGEYTYSASVQINVSNAYLPMEVMYVPVDTFVPGETYLIGYVSGGRKLIMGNEYYDTNNNRTLKPVQVTFDTVAGVTCITTGVDENQEWVFSTDGTVKNGANNLYLNLTGNYLTMGSTPVHWSYTPTEGATTGMLINDANSTFKYLGINNSATYFSVFFSSTEIQLFRKLVRSAETPAAGDIDGNGSVTSSDALLLLRYTMGLAALTPEQLALADIDGNGTINSADALAILRMTMAL
ncbi:MAG: Ig-like domain-containing protein [Clostridia bacterium]|nr:Ig-like domain-containing protein [Clostridia bacterium]